MTLDICLAMIVSAMFYRNYKACEREQNSNKNANNNANNKNNEEIL